MSVAADYEAFLKGTTVFHEACGRLADDAALHEFIRVVMREKTGMLGTVPMSEALAWFLFEEIGWPEGRGYVFDALASAPGSLPHYTSMIRRSDPGVHGRLELRRARWGKPTKSEFLAAHIWLLETLKEVVS